MSTYDVPGYRAENRDQLAAGCWAENPDGSLIVVGSVDNGFTRYLVFDTSESPPAVFANAMSSAEFMRKFSLGASGAARVRVPRAVPCSKRATPGGRARLARFRRARTRSHGSHARAHRSDDRRRDLQIRSSALA